MGACLGMGLMKYRSLNRQVHVSSLILESVVA